MRALIPLAVVLPAVAAAQGWTPDAAARFRGAEDAAVAAAPDGPWWVAVGGELAEIIPEGLRANRDLKAAAARVLLAEAAAAQSLTPGLPFVGLSGALTTAPTSTLGFAFGAGGQGATGPELYHNGNVTLAGSWSTNLFGAQIVAFHAGGRDTLATEQERDALAVSVVGLVAEAWLDAAQAAEQVAVTEAQLGVSRDLLEVTRQRYEVGQGSAVDVFQQQQQVANAEAALPQSQALRATARARLALLLGREPGRPAPDAAALVELPAPQPTSPQSLLADRPDLRAQRQRVAAEAERKGAAALALAPTVGVNARAGWQFLDRGTFVDQEFWSIGASFDFPLLAGGGRFVTLKRARAVEADRKEAQIGAVLTAVQEVEAAIARVGAAQDVLSARERGRTAAEHAFSESRARYIAGLDGFLNVLSTQNALLAARLGEVAARRELASARLRLHQTLGGPWTRGLGDAP